MAATTHMAQHLQVSVELYCAALAPTSVDKCKTAIFYGSKWYQVYEFKSGAPCCGGSCPSDLFPVLVEAP